MVNIIFEVCDFIFKILYLIMKLFETNSILEFETLKDRHLTKTEVVSTH